MRTAGENADFPWQDQWPEITDPKIRAAFGRVPRAAFVDKTQRRYARDDAPLPIGEGQTISQPFVVALMVQALALVAGAKVLEIGAGSGFQTAILAEVTAVAGQPLGINVYAVERSPVLARRAGAVLANFGYFPHLRVGDGAEGWPETAPFDAIVVSAAASHLPRPLWNQLAEGGRMAIPIGEAEWGQELWLVGKRENKLDVKQMGGVRFVPLISPLLNDRRMWAEVD